MAEGNKTYTNPDGSEVEIPVSTVIKSLAFLDMQIYISPGAARKMGEGVFFIQGGNGEIFIGDEVAIEDHAVLRSDDAAIKAIGRAQIGSHAEVFAGEQSSIVIKDEARIGAFARVSSDSSSQLEISGFAVLEDGVRERHAQVFLDDQGALAIRGQACVAASGSVIINHRAFQIDGETRIEQSVRPGLLLTSSDYTPPPPPPAPEQDPYRSRLETAEKADKKLSAPQNPASN